MSSNSTAGSRSRLASTLGSGPMTPASKSDKSSASSKSPSPSSLSAQSAASHRSAHSAHSPANSITSSVKSESPTIHPLLQPGTTSLTAKRPRDRRNHLPYTYHQRQPSCCVHGEVNRCSRCSPPSPVVESAAETSSQFAYSATGHHSHSLAGLARRASRYASLRTHGNMEHDYYALAHTVQRHSDGGGHGFFSHTPAHAKVASTGNVSDDAEQHHAPISWFNVKRSVSAAAHYIHQHSHASTSTAHYLPSTRPTSPLQHARPRPPPYAIQPPSPSIPPTPTGETAASSTASPNSSPRVSPASSPRSSAKPSLRPSPQASPEPSLNLSPCLPTSSLPPSPHLDAHTALAMGAHSDSLHGVDLSNRPHPYATASSPAEELRPLLSLQMRRAASADSPVPPAQMARVPAVDSPVPEGSLTSPESLSAEQDTSPDVVFLVQEPTSGVSTGLGFPTGNSQASVDSETSGRQREDPEDEFANLFTVTEGRAPSTVQGYSLYAAGTTSSAHPKGQIPGQSGKSIRSQSARRPSNASIDRLTGVCGLPTDRQTLPGGGTSSRPGSGNNGPPPPFGYRSTPQARPRGGGRRGSVGSSAARVSGADMGSIGRSGKKISRPGSGGQPHSGHTSLSAVMSSPNMARPFSPYIIRSNTSPRRSSTSLLDLMASCPGPGRSDAPTSIGSPRSNILNLDTVDSPAEMEGEMVLGHDTPESVTPQASRTPTMAPSPPSAYTPLLVPKHSPGPRLAMLPSFAADHPKQASSSTVATAKPHSCPTTMTSPVVSTMELSSGLTQAAIEEILPFATSPFRVWDTMGCQIHDSDHYTPGGIFAKGHHAPHMAPLTTLDGSTHEAGVPYDLRRQRRSKGDSDANDDDGLLHHSRRSSRPSGSSSDRRLQNLPSHSHTHSHSHSLSNSVKSNTHYHHPTDSHSNTHPSRSISHTDSTHSSGHAQLVQVQSHHRPSHHSQSPYSQSQLHLTMRQSQSQSSWHNLLPPRQAIHGLLAPPVAKRVYRGKDGRDVHNVYKVGYETPVLDLESRLHETMYELAGGRHSFVDYGVVVEGGVEGDWAPATVLDIGTGLGRWPISAALAWPESRIVACDLVPIHSDLAVLAAAEERARTSSQGVAEGKGLWAGVRERVKFETCDFLDILPYDAGVFDMVHIRFVGLGVPENKWAHLLDEAIRVLRPGGVLEIVEMSVDPEPDAPQSLRNSFASFLSADFVQSNPLLSLQHHLPSTRGVEQATLRGPVFSAAFHPVPSKFHPDGAPGALYDAGQTWIRSALEYKGTAGMCRKPRKRGDTLSGVSPVSAPSGRISREPSQTKTTTSESLVPVESMPPLSTANGPAPTHPTANSFPVTASCVGYRAANTLMDFRPDRWVYDTVVGIEELESMGDNSSVGVGSPGTEPSTPVSPMTPFVDHRYDPRASAVPREDEERGDAPDPEGFTGDIELSGGKPPRNDFIQVVAWVVVKSDR